MNDTDRLNISINAAIALSAHLIEFLLVQKANGSLTDDQLRAATHATNAGTRAKILAALGTTPE